MPSRRGFRPTISKVWTEKRAKGNRAYDGKAGEGPGKAYTVISTWTSPLRGMSSRFYICTQIQNINYKNQLSWEITLDMSKSGS